MKKFVNFNDEELNEIESLEIRGGENASILGTQLSCIHKGCTHPACVTYSDCGGCSDSGCTDDGCTVINSKCLQPSQPQCISNLQLGCKS